MRIQFNIEKKHLYLGVLFLALFGISFVFALSADKIPWHALQQVSTTSTGTTSVDVNNNNIIDDADKLNSFPPSFYKDADKIKSKEVYWSGDKLCVAGSCGANTATCTPRTDNIGNVNIECADPDIGYPGGQFDAASMCKYSSVAGCCSTCQSVTYTGGSWLNCNKKITSAGDIIWLGTLSCTLSKNIAYTIPDAPKCATFQ